MSIASMRCEQALFWPVLTMLVGLVWAILAPVSFVAVVIFAALLIAGFRFPIATAGIVLVCIPVIDQAIAESEFVELFGALRITPAVMLKGMMTLVVISYLIRKKVNPLRYPILKPMLLWLAYTLCTCVWFHDRPLALSMWMRLAYWVLYLVFFFVVAVEDKKTRTNASGCASSSVVWLWRAGVIATALFAGSVLLAKAMGVGGEFYGVGESYGFYPDPWNMAMMLPGGLVLVLLYPWISRDSRMPVKIGSLLLASFTVLASFLTYTRTSLIACFFVALLVAFTLNSVVRSRQTRAMLALAIIIVIVVGVAIVGSIANSKSDNQLSARWSEVDKGEVGSGRLEVYYAAWSKFSGASPLRKLLGHGIGAGPEAAEEFMGVYVYLHDDLLEMLVCAGLIGIALYCWFFAQMYHSVVDGFRAKSLWAVAALASLAAYNLTSISYMRMYAVTPNTYFALVAGTSLGMLHTGKDRESEFAKRSGTCRT